MTGSEKTVWRAVVFSAARRVAKTANVYHSTNAEVERARRLLLDAPDRGALPKACSKAACR